MNLFLRKLKFLKQRLTRGFSDKELWSLDWTIAKYVYPRLKAFKDYCKTYPPDLTPERWGKILDEMIWAFDAILHEEETMPAINGGEKRKIEAYFKRREKGLRLFAKYFEHLWN